jgi:hypothetical protein
MLLELPGADGQIGIVGLFPFLTRKKRVVKLALSAGLCQ